MDEWRYRYGDLSNQYQRPLYHHQNRTGIHRDQRDLHRYQCRPNIYTYTAAANHDPETDSTGTTIVVTKP